MIAPRAPRSRGQRRRGSGPQYHSHCNQCPLSVDVSIHTDIQIGIIWEQVWLASMPLKLNQTKLTMLKLTTDISLLPASVGTTLFLYFVLCACAKIIDRIMFAQCYCGGKYRHIKRRKCTKAAVNGGKNFALVARWRLFRLFETPVLRSTRSL